MKSNDFLMLSAKFGGTLETAASGSYRVSVIGQRNLKFSTALGDDADLIVRCLTDMAPDVEVREFVG